MRVYHIEIRSATSDRKLSKMGLGTNWDFSSSCNIKFRKWSVAGIGSVAQGCQGCLEVTA